MKVRSRHIKRGSVLVEATVVIVFLVMLLTLTVNAGKLLNQISWIFQSTYQIGTIAGESVIQERRQRSEMLHLVATTLHNFRWRNRPVSVLPLPTPTPTPSTTLNRIRVVGMEVPVNIPLITSVGIRSLNTKITAPILVEAARVSPWSTSYLNPERKYDCCGRVVTDYPSSCVTCVKSSCTYESCN